MPADLVETASAQYVTEPIEPSVGEATTFPPVAASYQTIWVSVTAVTASFASKICIGSKTHCVISPVLNGAAGAALIVKDTGVLVKLTHEVKSLTLSA